MTACEVFEFSHTSGGSRSPSLVEAPRLLVGAPRFLVDALRFLVDALRFLVDALRLLVEAPRLLGADDYRRAIECLRALVR